MQELCIFAGMKRIFFLFLACFVLAFPSLIGQQIYNTHGFVCHDSVTFEEFADAAWLGADTFDVSLESSNLAMDSYNVVLDSCVVPLDSCEVYLDSCEISLDSCIVVEGEDEPLTIESVFVNLQVDELSVLSEMNRLDLLDYANYGMKAVVENRYGGKTELTLKTEDYMHFAMTSVNSLDIILLNDVKGDTLVGMLSTLTAPFEYSRFRAYTPNGICLALTFPTPTTQDFVTSNTLGAVLMNKIETLPMAISYNHEDSTFECRLSTKRLTREEHELIDKHLTSIRFKWNGEGFVRI